MEKKTFEQLHQQRLAANEKLGDLYEKTAGREMTSEEKIQETNLTREMLQLDEQMKTLNREAEHKKVIADMSRENQNKQFREMMAEASKTGQKREILLFPSGSNVKGNITASGALELTIHEMIPTLHEGLGLPQSLNIVTGVTGNELWPVSINDVEMEEVGEVAALSEQVLNFENVQPTQKRVGLKVNVSNMAIDNAAFDLMAFVQAKFTIALKKYLASKIYSQAQWTGNKGPFSGLSSTGNIDLSGNAYKQILKAVAKFSDKGFFDGNVYIILDAETEAELKATPKISGAAGGFVIENGLCAGYPYITTHYINTELSGTSLVPTTDKYIGFGYFEFLAVQQHGEVRMVVDPITKADNGVTRVILNTAWSFTDLSKYINGGEPTGDSSAYTYPTQAFALYKVVEGEASSGEQ